MTADKSDKSIYGHDVATIMAASCRSRKKLDGSREIKTSKRTKQPRGVGKEAFFLKYFTVLCFRCLFSSEILTSCSFDIGLQFCRRGS